MMINILNKINDDKLKKIVFSIFILQPILELDYLIEEFIDPIPRPSTVFHLLIIPLIILLVYLKKEDQKRKYLYLFASYITLLGVYFVIHNDNCIKAFDSLYLTNNFYYDFFKEFIYIYTLVIPYFLIYSFYRANIDLKKVEKWLIITSLVVSIAIIIGDLFLFGLSTYSAGTTTKNIFAWFNNDPEVTSPRSLSSKFFYPEGNTLGIYLSAILPIIYYRLMISKDKKDIIFNCLAIFFQSIAMMIVSTRIGTYGTVLIPAACLIIYLLFFFIKKIEFNLTYIILTAILTILLGALIPYSPAYINQKIDHENDTILLNDNYLLEQAREGMSGEGLVPGSAEYNYYYIHYFEDWGIRTNLISSVSKEYYLYYYNYKFDAKFWWDVLERPLEERCNGRQVQTIFNNYKWSNTGIKTKILGMGYTTFMNGSFLIERDFVQQIYTLGYLGCILTLSPWIAVGIYGIYKILSDFNNKFRPEIIIYSFSYCLIMLSSIVSGHTLDQYLTTTLLSLICFVLLKKCNANNTSH